MPRSRRGREGGLIGHPKQIMGIKESRRCRKRNRSKNRRSNRSKNRRSNKSNKQCNKGNPNNLSRNKTKPNNPHPHPNNSNNKDSPLNTNISALNNTTRNNCKHAPC